MVTGVRFPSESPLQLNHLRAFSAWAFSSVGQSSRLITDRSGVQVPEGPPFGYGAVVQLVRMPACHAGGRGFEPLPRRHYAWVAQLVEQQTENLRVGGSTPPLGTNPAVVAQW